MIVVEDESFEDVQTVTGLVGRERHGILRVWKVERK